MTKPKFLVEELQKLAPAPHESSVETILEFRLGRCAGDSRLQTSPDSPITLPVEDATGLSVIYPASPEPLSIVLLPDRDLFFFVAENELILEATDGEERLIVILGEDAHFRALATLGPKESARVTFAGLITNRTYAIAVIALVSADSLFKKGEEIFNAGGSRNEALTHINRAVAVNPNFAQAWRRKAYIHRELGEAELALSAAEQSVRADPNYALGWRCKGAILRDKNEHQLGLDCYLRSLELDPTDSLCWHNKGNALSALGRNEEAKAAHAEADRVSELYPHRS